VRDQTREFGIRIALGATPAHVRRDVLRRAGIVAGAGALATSARNTLATAPTNDFSLSTYKELNITERVKVRIGAQFANIINHPQFIPGSNPGQGLGVNDVASFTTTTSNYLAYVTPSDANFNKPRSVFASNARTIALVAKFIF